MTEHEHWDIEIKPKTNWFRFNLREVWAYRDLISQFVRRDIVAVYKQTLLGPVWFLIQPILTTVVFTFIFGRIAKLAPGQVPDVLFYMAGIIPWTYFSECLIKTSTTFTGNASIYGKVYFPRLVIPISVVFSSLAKFGVQMILFLGTYLYYVLFMDYQPVANATLFLFPLVILLMGGLGLSLGIFISSLTTKYRDLGFLVAFGVDLLKFASTLVFPFSIIMSQTQKTIIGLNPMTSVIETFRYGFLGEKAAVFSWEALAYSTSFMGIMFVVAVLIFNRVEKSFMDTV